MMHSDCGVGELYVKGSRGIVSVMPKIPSALCSSTLFRSGLFSILYVGPVGLSALLSGAGSGPIKRTVLLSLRIENLACHMERLVENNNQGLLLVR